MLADDQKPKPFRIIIEQETASLFADDDAITKTFQVNTEAFASPESYIGIYDVATQQD